MNCLMNEDINLALMSGIDIPLPLYQISLHQPTIKEISLIGEKTFFIGVQTLCMQKNMYLKDEKLLAETSNFQIFMTVMTEKETLDKKQSVIQVLTLLFPSYKIIFTPRSLLLNFNDTNVIIDETNFEYLQDILQKVFSLSSSSADTFNPGNEAAQAIANKLMRGRQRVAAQKGETDEKSILSRYVSILAVGLHSSLQEMLNLTVYQVYDLIERFQLNISWELDLRQRLAGAKPDSTPENWMKNIH